MRAIIDKTSTASTSVSGSSGRTHRTDPQASPAAPLQAEDALMPQAQPPGSLLALQRIAAGQPTPAGGPGGMSNSEVHETAKLGTGGAGGPLPFLDTIQRSFGKHDVSGVTAHTDDAAASASAALGAAAFTTGDHVAFAGRPSLHTTAHEAAHAVQQRAGVQLAGGVGVAGDPYERHADAVADLVVQGRSAEPLLNEHSGARGAPPVQTKPANSAAPASVVQFDDPPAAAKAAPPAAAKAPAPAKAPAAVKKGDPTTDKLNALETRTTTLEKKTEAIQLDLKYRALFGAKLANYKQIIYRLSNAFRTALSGYQTAHGKQAAKEAVLDQVVATVILVGAAGALEPLLTRGLGGLNAVLGRVSGRIPKVNVAAAVEKLENPINAGASGAGNTITTKRAGDRAADAQAADLPNGAATEDGSPGAKGAPDPLAFLTTNMEAVEKHAQGIETAFGKRATAYEGMTPADWAAWTKAEQEKVYTGLLAELDSAALGDISKLEGPDPLAAKIELYLWAAWIQSHTPGVKGLQIGGDLAKRMKELGVESLAMVRFDTESWVFMNHSSLDANPWEDNLRKWAKTFKQKLTK